MYTDFKKRKMFAAGQQDKERKYWINKLSGELLKTGFPSDTVTTGGVDRKLEVLSFQLHTPLFKRLMEIINNSDSRLHIVLVTGLTLLLFKYTGNKDIIIGTPIDKQDVEGEFINTILPLRTQIDEQMCVKEFLMKVKQVVIEANDNQNYPIETIPYELGISMIEGESPLFDTAILLQNIQDKQYIQHINLNMIFSFLRKDDLLEGTVEYNTSIFERKTIERIVDHFIHVMHEAFFHVYLKLIDVAVLSEEEKKRMVLDFNKTSTDYPSDKMIHRLFEEQVEKTPHFIAVESGSEILTYKELNEKANQLARLLREKGIGNDTTAAIMLETSLEIPLAIMAVLKAGGAYLPIGYEYPDERIDYMLKHGRVKLLLRRESPSERKDLQCPVIYLDDETLYKGDYRNLKPMNHVNSLAYIIYTSGTTGQPKGVMVEHRALVNYIWWAARTYVKDEYVDFPLHTSISFDLTITSIFVPLITGNSIIVYGGVNKKFYIEDMIDENRVGVVKLTPSHLKLILSKKVKDSKIKRLIVGGEELESRLARDIYSHFDNKVEIYNEYGPTETVVGSMIYKYDPMSDSRYAVPIGVPIANTRVYLLNRHLQPIPVGAVGEIYIGGDGLARGYLHNLGMTEEKFRPDPFIPGQKMYKTGDLAIRLPDGNIEYKGRTDHQVKIRGYRIEVGEIETKIIEFLEKVYPGLEKTGCIITDVKDGMGERALCAYILSYKELDVSQLKTYLFQELPDYMIPTYYTWIDSIPLTASGKVDRKALPIPELTLEKEYVAPRDSVEEKLAEVWSEVLGIKKEKVGVGANFFEVGGHSLRATFLVAAVQKHFNVKLPLVKIFESPTIRGQAKLLKDSAQEIFASIDYVEEKEYYVLSSAQRRLYILQQMDLNSTAYNVHVVVELEGEADRKKLEETFKKLLQRHEGLRTSFIIVEDTPMQEIHQEVEFKIEYEEESQGDVGYIINNFIRPFYLSKAPLLRVGLIKTAPLRRILMVDLHHIITDGISHIILINDFMSLYNDIQLPALRLQYKNYSEWQQSKPVKESLKRQEEFWLKEFAGEIPVLNIPTDYSRLPVQSFEGSSVGFEIGEEKVTALNEIARLEGATLFMVLLTIIDIFLSKISTQEDIVVGVPIAGRKHADMEQIIGMFVNTLALHSYPSGEKTFITFLNEIKERTLDAFENQDYPFEELVEKIAVRRDMSRNPLFDVLFVLQNIFDPSGNISEKKIRDFKIKPYSHEHKISKFDLTLTGVENGEKLNFAFEYCTKLFREETILRFIRYFKKIISSVIEKPGKKISEIEIITEEEKKRILYEFNCIETKYPEDKTIHRLFEEQVERAPDHIAVIYSPIQITYRELNEKSNLLAHVLRQKGVEPDTIIAIMVERSVEMIIGILGILKAGGAYLPIDPEYPQERIDFMLKDSSAKVVLTGQEIADFSSPQASLILSEGRPFNSHSSKNRITHHSCHLAYIIYTSGTTGQPKGVLLEHKNVVRLLFNDGFQFDFNETDVWSLFHSFGFDFSVWEMYGALLYGGRLVVVPRMTTRDPYQFREILIDQNVTVLNQTPSAFYSLIYEELKSSNRSLCLRYAIFGGEALNPGKLIDWWERYPSTKLVNMFGITETCVHVTYKEIGELEIEGDIGNIGKPIPTLTTYVMDCYRKLLPVGVAGELYVGGEGVSMGYLNRPELTKDRFLENLYKKRERLYRSGDKVKLCADGEMVYLGRLDQQVQLRGFRIEMGEIDNRLLKYDEVKEAVVIDCTTASGDLYLCAYIVPQASIEAGALNSRVLREFLSRHLPDYMIPSYFVQMEKIPLTANGKIDRGALPKPELKVGEGYTAPRNEIEAKLLDVWSNVLNLERDVIGIDSNFFELGGHSLNATVVISKIHKVFDVKVPLVEIFKMPRIKELANYIKGKSREFYISIEPAEEKEYYLLSSAQKRLYILQQMNPDSTAYNMPEIIPLPAESDWEKIEDTFKKLIKRHESLRTSFHMVSDTPIQVVHDELEFEIEYYDMKEVKVEEGVGTRGLAPLSEPATAISNPQLATSTIKNFIRPLDLSNAPLMRVRLLKTGEGGHLLLVDMHHIISDGVSHEILVKDFLSLYEGMDLLPLRVQYKDFSQWQNGEKEKENLKHQEEFWLKELEGEIPVLELPTDYPRPVEQSFEGNSLNFEITGEETRALKAMALTGGSTLFMVLVAVVNILLSKLSGQEEIILGTPIAGRRHTDLEKIIGMFVNTLSLRNYPAGDRTFREFLDDVKERTLLALENQEYPFEELVDKVSVKRDIGRNPLFDILFVLQNMNTGLAGQDKETEIETSQPIQPNSPKEYENIFQTAKFDLTLSAMEIGQGLFLSFEYCTKLFKKETVERFISYFKKIVSIAVKEPGIRISEIEIISEEEKNRLLLDFNDTQTEYPKDKTIHQLFEDQAVKTPDHTALIGKNPKQEGTGGLAPLHITYRELNEKSNRLAHVLQSKGVGPDAIVGIMVVRSVEMIAGIMGILKSGGAYLPIDPEYTEERIDYMLKDSGAKTLLTGNELSNFPSSPPSTSTLTSTCQVRPTNLAYIIYTSGSTGKPKGVLVEHRNVANTVNWYVDIHKVGSSTRILQVSDYTFDASVDQIFGALISGAILYIIEKEIRLDTEKLRNYIIDHTINVIDFVPTHLKELLCYADKLESLHTVISGAEKLEEIVKEAIIGKGYRLVNQYGPTETTIDALALECSGEMVSLGKPISNVTVYILDKYLKIVPIGVVGELHIAGAGVARGYLNLPGLTAKKFISSSPLTPHLSPLYKTGDLARWLPDGNIEFLGRIDHQVKIHGFRVELGEIENRLLLHPGIKEAVAMLREEKKEDKYLCVYIVSDSELVMSELREYLSKELPDYMIPSYFIELDKIPLTPNGKVDRRTLPKPELKAGEGYTAPRNEIEEKLVELWSEILGRDELHTFQLQTSIGINHNFFELGGHSLKATILASRIHKELNVKLPLAEFFKTPTIRGLSESIKRLTKNKYKSIYSVEDKEYYDLSSAQKRLYSFHQMDEKSTKFNMPTAIRLEGPFIKNKVEEAFKKLIKRHESFRTSFEMIENVPVQVIHDTVGIKVEYCELCNENEEEEITQIIKEFFRYFDLSQPPLLRVGMIKLAEEKHILMVDMHHILSDAQSVEITRNEFLVLYTGAELPGLKLQYKDFSEWQRRLFESGEIKKQEEYWLNRFKSDIPALNMPMDYDWPSVYRAYGGRFSFKVDSEITASLKRLVLETGNTLYIMLLAVFNILLSKYSRQEDIIVGSPIAGRRHVDLENMVGLFVNMLALRNRPARDKSFIEFLIEVKTDTLDAFENQDFQFENLVWKLGIKSEYNRNPLFNAVFVMQNTGTPTVNFHNKDELNKIRVLPYKIEIERVHHEILLSASEGKDELFMEFQYATELFKKSTIRKLSEHYVEILRRVIENRNVQLEDIKLSHDLLAANTEVIKESEVSFGF